MSILSIVLLVVFALVAVLLTFLIAIQSDGSTGLSGVFGGVSDSLFGGSANKALNKITTILAILFVVLALVCGFVNRSTTSDSLVESASETTVWNVETTK